MEKSSPRPAQLESTIRAITKDLLTLAVTPHVRELRAKAVTYGRVVGSWNTYAPSEPQVDAMVECVAELEEKVLEAKRDPSKPSRGHGETRESKKPLPSALPPSMEWNASVPEASGVRARRGSNPIPGKLPPSADEIPTRPPPPLAGAPAPSVPPLSTPRAIEPPTPIPALLRSHRSR